MAREMRVYRISVPRALVERLERAMGRTFLGLLEENAIEDVQAAINFDVEELKAIKVEEL